MGQIFKIIKFTKAFWKWYLFLGAFVIAISALSLANPFITKLIVDLIVARLQGSNLNIQALTVLLALMIITDITITTLTAFGQWISDVFVAKLESFLSSQFYQHLLDLDVGFYDNQTTGELTNKMYRGISSISGFLNNMINNFLPFFLTAFITIIVLARYSPLVAILLAVLFPAYIYISHNSSHAWSKIENQINAIKDTSQGRAYESLAGIRVVKAFSAQIVELANFLTSRHQIEKLTNSQSSQWHIYDFLRRLLLNFILFAIFAYIVYWTYFRRYTIGEMTLMLQLVNQARFPLFAMSFILGQIQQAAAGSRDFFGILGTPAKISDPPDAKPLKANRPLISFSHVSFEYGQGQPVLSDITFTIHPNEKLALVGESGQGKSTLVNLLLRYYSPQQGSIKIANQDISHVTQVSLRNEIAVVFQDTLLFSGSVIDNIRYGNPAATDADVIKSAQAANAHEFIEKLPQGYQSVVGERGVKLSGGQKQRIAIARAILKNAPIIILDEATSSLDSKSELAVQKGLDHLLKDRTAIIIAHRLSTISGADHVLVIAGGKVAEYGTAGELLAKKSGLYSQLVTLQRELLRAPSAARSQKLAKFDLVG